MYAILTTSSAGSMQMSAMEIGDVRGGAAGFRTSFMPCWWANRGGRQLGARRGRPVPRAALEVQSGDESPVRDAGWMQNFAAREFELPK